MVEARAPPVPPALAPALAPADGGMGASLLEAQMQKVKDCLIVSEKQSRELEDQLQLLQSLMAANNLAPPPCLPSPVLKSAVEISPAAVIPRPVPREQLAGRIPSPAPAPARVARAEETPSQRLPRHVLGHIAAWLPPSWSATRAALALVSRACRQLTGQAIQPPTGPLPPPAVPEATNGAEEASGHSNPLPEEQADKLAHADGIFKHQQQTALDETSSLTTMPARLPPRLEQRFELVDGLLGDGSVAIVRKLRDKSEGREVALKIMEKHPLLIRGMAKQVRSEVQLQSSLVHPNILRLLEVLEDETHVFMLLELCNGGLLSLLQRHPGHRLPEAAAGWLFPQVCEGVSYLHGRDVIHRDLKPDNILLDEHYCPKVCDFGWCADVSDGQPRRTICGTLDYMAPEVLLNEEHGLPVDLWSLGILLYEILSSYTPFATAAGGCSEEFMAKIMKVEYPFPPWFSNEACHLVHCLLQRQPGHRWVTSKVLCHPWVYKQYVAPKQAGKMPPLEPQPELPLQPLPPALEMPSPAAETFRAPLALLPTVPLVSPAPLGTAPLPVGTAPLPSPVAVTSQVVATQGVDERKAATAVAHLPGTSPAIAASPVPAPTITTTGPGMMKSLSRLDLAAGAVAASAATPVPTTITAATPVPTVARTVPDLTATAPPMSAARQYARQPVTLPSVTVPATASSTSRGARMPAPARHQSPLVLLVTRGGPSPIVTSSVSSSSAAPATPVSAGVVVQRRQVHNAPAPTAAVATSSSSSSLGVGGGVVHATPVGSRAIMAPPATPLAVHGSAGGGGGTELSTGPQQSPATAFSFGPAVTKGLPSGAYSSTSVHQPPTSLGGFSASIGVEATTTLVGASPMTAAGIGVSGTGTPLSPFQMQASPRAAFGSAAVARGGKAGGSATAGDGSGMLSARSTSSQVA
eukprot:TRINITY_DN51535_c0_g1_i1.p1 TRINITY_DN51535_c0_g1~~TRINITY_DN51535_c0_g1_i1.p1  ORF type:complete len:922 (+),score=184.75 TRINITY_DN51535_c0_g1_i1:212-2977(+)